MPCRFLFYQWATTRIKGDHKGSPLRETQQRASPTLYSLALERPRGFVLCPKRCSERCLQCAPLPHCSSAPLLTGYCLLVTGYCFQN